MSTHTFGYPRFSALVHEQHRYRKPYLQEWTKRIEEPPVAVDLLLIPLLHTEDDLRGHDALVGIFKVQVRVDCKRRRVLE
jgi:hypothetical protein